MKPVIYIFIIGLLSVFMPACTSTPLVPPTAESHTGSPLPLVKQERPTPVGTAQTGAVEIGPATSSPLTSDSSAAQTVDSEDSIPVVLPEVRLESDSSDLQGGELIQFTVHNPTNSTLYPYTGREGCGALVLQVWRDDQWVVHTDCLPQIESGPLAAGATWTYTLAAPTGDPIAPNVFEGDLSSLATLTPPPPDYQGPEIPRGIAPTAAPGGQPGTSLPARYRFALAYSLDSDLEVVRVIYSNDFIVSD